ncbi:tubulin polyglutamylase TTLL6-like [Lutzomyia longipalpis]|uniref:tubulin polyglutamylase TTLL6-like n=1 Tax=Lutzomyia longipalpis TaxID=7200 RepID=UPI0024836F11|nr:tubulin polyglutamylase TTLL6-like [Lutzomyia longipalpis]
MENVWEMEKIDKCSKEEISQRNKGKGSSSRKKQIKFCASQTRYQSVIRVAKDMGFRLVNMDDAWNILWSDGSPSLEFIRQMKSFQRINHFPGMQELSMKRCLARNLNRMIRSFPEEYAIFPRTWCLPMEINEAQEYSRSHPSTVFILKPDHGSQGRGIRLCRNLRVSSMTQEKVICQEYVKTPLLVDGFKFDMRVYVLISDMDPLRIYVYNEGLARFATNKYRQPTLSNKGDIFMHLTNYSLNKNSLTFCLDTENGSKRTFAVLNRILHEDGINVKKLWEEIDDVILKTIFSAYTTLRHVYKATFHNHRTRSGAFEVLGFDIIIDKKLKPFILEVNQSPSFHTDQDVDLEVKCSLIRDTFRLLLTSRRNCGNFRLLWPNPLKSSYTQFLEHPSSLFATTKSAQIRQEMAQNMRERLQKAQNIAEVPTKALQQQPSKEVHNDWESLHIEDIRANDHDRTYALAQRNTMIRISGIQYVILQNMFENDLLTWSDRVKFEPIIERLRSSDEPMEFTFLDIDGCHLRRIPTLRGVRKNRTTMLREISRTITA